MSFKLLFTIIFVSLLLAVGLLGYRLFYQDPVLSEVADDGSGVSSAGLSVEGEDGNINSEATDYARLLRVIEGIPSIDRSIFTSAVFTSLFDFNFTIPSQTAGRRNPFAPVGTP